MVKIKPEPIIPGVRLIGVVEDLRESGELGVVEKWDGEAGIRGIPPFGFDHDRHVRARLLYDQRSSSIHRVVLGHMHNRSTRTPVS